jgi:hypothetical protein
MYVHSAPVGAGIKPSPWTRCCAGTSQASIYQPFLTGAVGARKVTGGVDISDARSGQLAMRIFLPQQLVTDVDALHGDFLTLDENGQ